MSRHNQYVKHVMEVGEKYGGVIFIKEIPNPGKTNRRYCLVECSHCGNIVGRTFTNVQSGTIQSCGCKFKKSGTKSKVSVGDLSKSSTGEEVEVVEYINHTNVRVMFTATGMTTITTSQHIINGTVVNPEYPTVAGVAKRARLPKGIEEGERIRRAWWRMFRRVVKNEHYKGVKIAEDWYTFENFLKWALLEPFSTMDGYDLDKDILSGEEKIYGPETCCFIPSSLNKQLINFDKCPNYRQGGKQSWWLDYKDPMTDKRTYTKVSTEEEAIQLSQKLKSERIRFAAEKYRGQITERAYQALILKASMLIKEKK